MSDEQQPVVERDDVLEKEARRMARQNRRELRRGSKITVGEETPVEVVEEIEEIAELQIAQIAQIEQPTDEEILLDGAGDVDFLYHALQFRDRPDRYRGDFKFVTRLAARRARRHNQITAAEHEQVLSLIRKPIRLHKETKKPFNAWGEFENLVRAEMPKAMVAKSGIDWSDMWKQIVEWFKENWTTVLKIALSVLLMLV